MKTTTKIHFGHEFDLNLYAHAKLDELERTGCITTTFIFGELDENDEGHPSWWRIRLTPSEIGEYLLFLKDTPNNALPPRLESLLCGHLPWRYEMVPDDESPPFESKKRELDRLFSESSSSSSSWRGFRTSVCVVESEPEEET